MEKLFQIHKPRIKDHCFIKKEILMNMVRNGIQSLRKISKRPRRVFVYITRFIKSFPFLLTYLLFIQWIQKYWKDINITDSIFLHNIIHLNDKSFAQYKDILPIISSRSNYEPKVAGIFFN